jgi:hypothetical protein
MASSPLEVTRPMSRNLKFTKVAAIALTHVALASMLAGTANTNYELKPINLPSAHAVVALDYFAYDRSTGKLWVPAIPAVWM